MIWFGKSFIQFCKSFIVLIKLVSTRSCSSARVGGATRTAAVSSRLGSSCGAAGQQSRSCAHLLRAARVTPLACKAFPARSPSCHPHNGLATPTLEDAAYSTTQHHVSTVRNLHSHSELVPPPAVQPSLGTLWTLLPVC